jgi:hypothetical protein
MRQNVRIRRAKARQISKLAEIREALVFAGYDSTSKQAAVLGLCRSSTWVFLNRNRRVGPSATVLERILTSPKLPPAARQKIKEYIQCKIAGHYGHSERTRKHFAMRFRGNMPTL